VVVVACSLFSFNMNLQDCSFDTPSTELPLQFIEDFQGKLQRTDIRLDNFSAAMDEVGNDTLRQVLGSNITRVHEVVDSIRNAAENLLDVIRLTLKTITCDRFLEVYTTVVDTAICYNAYYGLVWCFSSFLVMSFCGMMMITFRAVLYYPTGEIDDYSWNEVKAQEGEGTNDVTPGEVVGTNTYLQDEGIQGSSPTVTEPAEAPMGGQAQQAYDAVGDDNPFADAGESDCQPKKSSWE
jgi:hypothetical protein